MIQYDLWLWASVAVLEGIIVYDNVKLVNMDEILDQIQEGHSSWPSLCTDRNIQCHPDGSHVRGWWFCVLPFPPKSKFITEEWETDGGKCEKIKTSVLKDEWGQIRARFLGCIRDLYFILGPRENNWSVSSKSEIKLHLHFSIHSWTCLPLTLTS